VPRVQRERARAVPSLLLVTVQRFLVLFLQFLVSGALEVHQLKMICTEEYIYLCNIRTDQVTYVLY
jgi:hypothetical protein